MLNGARIFAIYILNISVAAESMPIQVPAKPTLTPRQAIAPKPTPYLKPLTPLSQQELQNRNSVLFRQTSSYTLELAPEVIKGACLTTVTETETQWLVFRKQSNVLRYADGRRDRSVIFYVRDGTVGPQLLQPSQTETKLKQCLSSQTATDEEALRSQMNVCLNRMGSSLEVSYLTTSAGELQCPTQPGQKQAPSK